MPADNEELPAMIVIDDPPSAGLPARTIWRQIAGISVAWVAMLVSLVAVPGLRVFLVVAFLGVLVAVGISWAFASRAETKRARPAGQRAPVIR
jgi:hypothetical protein